jgi:hypothetical protein
MPARPRIHHTIKEKLHLRRHKRKNGPSAKRRAERRLPLQRTVTATIMVEDTLTPALHDASEQLESIAGEHSEVIDAINEEIGITEGDPA